MNDPLEPTWAEDEINRLKDRVVTLEDGIREHRAKANIDLGVVITSPYDKALWDLLDASHDRDNERARQADIGANLPTGFVDQLDEEADR